MKGPPLAIALITCLLMGCAYAPENLAKRAVAHSDAKRSTADWKLRHAQLEREIAPGTQWTTGKAYEERQLKLREMEHIERELFRRYKAGDTGAYLPIFEK